MQETFVGETSHEGHDGEDGRSVRYLEWTIDPDPIDTTFRTDYVIALRDHTGDTRVVHDCHIQKDCFRAPSGCACCVKPDSSRAHSPMLGARDFRRETSTLRSASRFQNRRRLRSREAVRDPSCRSRCSLRRDDRFVRRMTSARPRCTSGAMPIRHRGQVVVNWAVCGREGERDFGFARGPFLAA